MYSDFRRVLRDTQEIPRFAAILRRELAELLQQARAMRFEWREEWAEDRARIDDAIRHADSCIIGERRRRR